MEAILRFFGELESHLARLCDGNSNISHVLICFFFPLFSSIVCFELVLKAFITRVKKNSGFLFRTAAFFSVRKAQLMGF